MSALLGLQDAVRPGKPSYRTAFQQLAENKVFAAQNELTINNKAIAEAQATVKSSSDEVSGASKRTIGEADSGRYRLYSSSSSASYSLGESGYSAAHQLYLSKSLLESTNV